jgi:hypothetical protein
MEYHGTKELVLTSTSIVNLQSGVFRCSAQYSCRNTENVKWFNVLVRGNRMPNLNAFVIGDEVGIKIGNNGFTTFNVTGYAENILINDLNPVKANLI